MGGTVRLVYRVDKSDKRLIAKAQGRRRLALGIAAIGPQLVLSLASGCRRLFVALLFAQCGDFASLKLDCFSF